MAASYQRPKYLFCWVCSRKLHGRAHQVVIIDGAERIVHKQCALGYPPPFRSADHFNASDAHGECPEEE